MKRRKGIGNYRAQLAAMNRTALDALPPLDANASTLWDATCGPTLTAGASAREGRNTPQPGAHSGSVAVKVVRPHGTKNGPFAPTEAV